MHLTQLYLFFFNSVDTAITPDTVTLQINEQTPTLDTAIGGPVGSLIINEQTASLDIAIGVPTGSVSVTGLAPSAEEDHIRQVPIAPTLTLSEQSISLDIAIRDPPVDTLALTGLTPSGEIDHNRAVPAGSLSITGQNVYGPILVPSGSLTITGTTPTPVFPITSEPGTGGLSVGTQTPQRGRGLRIRGLAPFADLEIVPTGTLTLNGQAPSAEENSIRAVPAGSISITGQSVSLPIPVPAGSLTLSGLSPVFPITVATGGLSVGTQTPQRGRGLRITGLVPFADLDIVPVGRLRITGFTPAAVKSYVEPPSGSVRITGLSFQSGLVIQVPTGGPLVITGQGHELDPATLRITGFAPAVARVPPIVGNDTLTITTGTPVSLLRDTSKDSLSITGLAPVVLRAPPFVKSDNLRITGYAPLLFQPTLTPDKGSLSINTTTPTLKYRVLDTIRDALAYEDEFVIKRRVADPEERMLEAVMRAFLENMNGN